MYLSAKKAHQPRGLTEHEELEMLLESFSKQVEEIVSELETMTVGSFFKKKTWYENKRLMRLAIPGEHVDYARGR